MNIQNPLNVAPAYKVKPVDYVPDGVLVHTYDGREPCDVIYNPPGSRTISLLITPDSGAQFIARVECELDQLFATGDPFVLLAGAVFLDTSNPGVSVDSGLHKVVEVHSIRESELLLLIGFCEIAAYRGSARQWVTPRVSLDGIAIESVTPETITGTVFLGVRDGPFVVDSSTGELLVGEALP